MSFVGQFGPALQLGGLRNGSRAIKVFGIGFLLSSTLTFFTATRMGAVARTHLADDVRTVATLGTLVLMVLVETIMLFAGTRFSLGLTRQTPERWRRSAWGVFAWGIDTGIPVTTVRATMLPASLLVVAVGGFAPTLVGVFYAIGFVVAIVLSSILPRSWTRSVRASQRPDRMLIDRMRSLSARVRFARQCGLVAVIVGLMTAVPLSFT